MQLNKKESFKKIFPWVFMVLGAIFTLILIYYKDFYMENSDIASDMILGKLLSQEGGILSKNWFYSTELHVIHTQLVYKFLFYIWPENYLMVRLAAAVIFLVLIVGSFIYMTASAGLKEEGILAASILTWPFSQWYVRIVTFGQSYVTYFIIAFVSMGLFFGIIKGKRGIGQIIKMVLLLVIAFVAGLGGVRLLMICYAPLFATGMVVLIYAHYNRFKGKDSDGEGIAKALLILGTSFVAFLGAVIGLYVNRNILSKEYTFQDQFRELWKDFSFDGFMNTLTDALTLFGWHANVNFVSWQGIINCFNFLLVVLIVVSIVRVYKRFGSYDKMVQLFLTYVGVLTLVTVMTLSCSYKYYVYYWLPVIPYFLVVLALEVRSEEFDYFKAYRGVVASYVALCIALASVSVYADPNPDDIYQDYAIVDAIEWLKDTDYTDGFAMFWSSNVVIALTDGRIDMHTVKNIDNLDDLSNEYEWLQSMDHTRSLPEGRFFVLVSARDYDLGNTYSADIFKLSDHLVYGTDSAYIYSFESMDDYIYAVNNAE